MDFLQYKTFGMQLRRRRRQHDQPINSHPIRSGNSHHPGSSMTDNGKRPRHDIECTKYKFDMGCLVESDEQVCDCGLTELLQQGELAEQLKEALAELEADLIKATDDLTVSSSAINKQIDVNQELRTQVAELEQDRERLDWLEQAQPIVQPHMADCCNWLVFHGNDIESMGDTLRQAIDTARAAATDIPAQPAAGQEEAK